MATTHWECTRCNHIGKTATFNERGGYKCPKCKETDVFPYRIFQCRECGYQAAQRDFFKVELPTGRWSKKPEFSDVPSDPDPTEEKWPYDCSKQPDNLNECTSTSYRQLATKEALAFGK